MKITRLTKAVADLHPLLAAQTAFSLIIPKHTVAPGDILSFHWDMFISLPEDPLNLGHVIASLLNLSIQLDDSAIPPVNPLSVIGGTTIATGPANNDTIGSNFLPLAASFAVGLNTLPYTFLSTDDAALGTNELHPTFNVDSVLPYFIDPSPDKPTLFPKAASEGLLNTFNRYGFLNTPIDWNVNHTVYFLLNADADYDVTFPTYVISTANGSVRVVQGDNGNTASS